MTLITTSEDGVRLYVDGQLVIDNWTLHTATEDTYTFDVVAGQIVGIVLEWYEETGNSVIKLSWQSPSIPKQIIPAGPLQLPRKASSPIPTNGEVNVRRDIKLRWTSGDDALQHDVYFGTDENDVRNATTETADIYKCRQDLGQTSYIPGILDWEKTYYWRIDEIGSAQTWKGNVWSFTVADFVVVEDFEDYNDINNLIYDTWVDYIVNNTGMTVGHLNPPSAEQSIVHSGSQSMYMRYDNDGTVNEGTVLEQSGMLFYSEAQREWENPQDWTKDDANSLTIWFRGLLSSVGSFTSLGGNTYKITAAGADIWGTSDQFHFAYKRLSGNGEIKARVVSITNTDASAKAGVMIRETLEPGSKHIMVVAQPSSDNGIAFQRRAETNFTSEQIINLPGMLAPRYLKLTRSGNTFTAQHSSNNLTWTTIGSVDMPMLADVYIGLCLTAHNINAVCTAEFSSVSAPTGQWQSQDIGIESNIAEQLYLALQDDAGNSAVVNNADPLATTLITWTQWNIPFTVFTSVNMQAIKKLSIGVGDRAATQPGGAGTLYIDDIWLIRP
jgi:hypothetical protein